MRAEHIASGVIRDALLVVALCYLIEPEESPGGKGSMPSSYFPAPLWNFEQCGNSSQLRARVRVWKFCSVARREPVVGASSVRARESIPEVVERLVL